MKILVAIPCMDSCPIGFLRSVLSMQPVGNVQFTFAQGSLVYDARNQLANVAIDGGYDRMLWLDSDMEFGPDLMVRLSSDMDKGPDLVSGLYFSRKRPIHTVVYQKVYRDGNGFPHADTVQAWTDDIFEIAACGFGAVMVNVDLMKRVRDKYGLPFSPIMGFGEDLSFCLRVTDLGVKMYCDPTIEIGHIGQATYNYDTYAAEMRHK